ncbi:MAG: NYN domain-containing protein [Promethearchaeota archaeon]
MIVVSLLIVIIPLIAEVKKTDSRIYVSNNSLKAAVFIDHSNIASPNLEPNLKKSKRIDYVKLKERLLQGFEGEAAFVFMGVTDPVRPEKKDFMRYLETAGFILLTRPLAKRRDGTYKQKQVDILMTHIMEWKAQAKDFDVAILVSGDADFVIAVNLLQDMNKGVIVWSWKKSLSSQLRDAVGNDNVFYIDDIW